MFLSIVLNGIMEISEGSLHDVNALDGITLPSGSYLVMDRAYVDFERLNRLANDRINFVIRSKTNMKYEILNSGQTDQSTGVLSDQAIMLTGLNTKQKYSECLRRVRYFDAETKKTLVFLTNNFKISALTVAALYKSRWGIETFFYG